MLSPATIFGWNLGSGTSGTPRPCDGNFFIIILYITFTFSYTELACAFRKRRRIDYARRALGMTLASCRVAQNIELFLHPRNRFWHRCLLQSLFSRRSDHCHRRIGLHHLCFLKCV